MVSQHRHALSLALLLSDAPVSPVSSTCGDERRAFLEGSALQLRSRVLRGFTLLLVE
jgi:hypothetical protein